MNKVIEIGRWTKDLDLKYTPNGTAVANGTIAVNRTYVREGQPEVDFFNVVIWNKQAENAANYTGKGSKIAIDGRLQSRSYDSKDGNKVYVTEIVADHVEFLDPKKSEGQPIDISDDDLPF